jgi:hypothetical protein
MKAVPDDKAHHDKPASENFTSPWKAARRAAVANCYHMKFSLGT